MNDLWIGMFVGGIITIVFGHVAARIQEWWTFRKSTVRVPPKVYSANKSPGAATTARGAVTTSIEGSDVLERTK